MDFPKSVPSVGLVNGKFVDEDISGGTPGSLIPSVWGNAVTLEILKVIQAGGLVPDETDNGQLAAAIAVLVDNSKPGNATEAVRGVLKLSTVAQVIAGDDDSSAVTPLKLSQKLSAYIKQATETAFGWLKISTNAQVLAGADDTTVVTPLKLKQKLDSIPTVQVRAVQGAFKNLNAFATGFSAVVSVTVDEITLGGAANSYQTVRSVAITPSFAVAGANGVDVGAANSQLASTWYSVWVIWGGAATAGLLSLSATAPTMPAGYTHRARVGWARTDATVNKYPLGFTQAGRIVQPWVAVGSNVPNIHLMASGSVPVYTAVAVGNFIPTTAKRICVVPVLTNATNMVVVAPSAAYGGALNPTNPPPMQEYSNSGGGSFNTPKWMNLESTNIYWSTNGASNFLFCNGYEDNL